MTTTDEFKQPNEAYIATWGDKDKLELPPKRKLVIIACMDARVDPAAALGLKEGDATVIRNAGGLVAVDVIRSLVISQRLLGTREIAVFHHTKCGMTGFTTDLIRDVVKKEVTADPQVDTEAALKALDDIGSFREFSDIEASVKHDVEYLKNHPLVLKETVITGWVQELETGRARRIV